MRRIVHATSCGACLVAAGFLAGCASDAAPTRDVSHPASPSAPEARPLAVPTLGDVAVPGVPHGPPTGHIHSPAHGAATDGGAP